jgi:predicted ATPase/class 3 adenylate cyclase
MTTSNITVGIAGERRQLTALFYDVVGSTELLHRLDPEDFGRVQRQLHRRAAAIISENGGHLDRLMGDGGAAYFGFPNPVEDAAVCAVTAAFQLIDACNEISQELLADNPLRIRVGLATGVVVISDLTDTPLPGKEEIVGIAPALAARIQQDAAPGTVIVSDTTYRLTREAFDFVPLGAKLIKGFVTPIELWRPVSRMAPGYRFSPARKLSPFVDRVSEMAECRTRWGRARLGEGQLVAIGGEAGIGKSRLAVEVENFVRTTGGEIHRLQCRPRGNSNALHPLIDELRRSVHGDSTAATALTPDEIRSIVGPDARDDTVRMLSFLSGHRSSSTEFLFGSQGERQSEIKRLALDAVFDVWASRARIIPQLIVVEDLQWADTLTRAMIKEAPERIAPSPIMILVTTREEDLLSLPQFANVYSTSLARLDEGETPKLLHEIWPGPLPPTLSSFIHERSDGIPLFVEELAALIRDRCQEGASSPADWEAALQESGIATLQDLLMARLSSVGPARSIAQIASAIGREFQLELLSGLVDRESSAETVEKPLSSLLDAGIISVQGPGGATFRFRHALIQEAAYGSLLKADRKRIHARIADAIMSAASPAPADDIMAWHCEQAGRYVDAVRYALRAAEGCALRSALQEADRLLKSAETWLGYCAGDDASRELLLETLVLRGPVASALFGPGSSEARSVYERGVALCEELDHGDRARWFPLFWGWWFTAPDFATQQKRSESLLAHHRRDYDGEARLQALHCAWATGFHSGRHDFCLRCVREGLELYDAERAPISRARYGGHDARVCALGEQALSLWFTGSRDAAEDSMRKAMSWAEETQHIGSRLHALNYLIELRRYQSAHGEVLDLSDQMAEMAARHRFPGLQAKSRLYKGWALALTGSIAAGLSELEQGLAQHSETGTEEILSTYLDMHAEALAAAGRFDRAMQVIDTAIEGSKRSGQVFWLPELYRRRASVARACGAENDRVLSDLRTAMRIAGEQGSKVLASRAKDDAAAVSGTKRRRLDAAF